MENQIALEDLDDCFLGVVIIGRSQSAGSDNNPCPLERQSERFFHLLRRIAGGADILDVKTDIGKFLGNKCGVGVDGMPGKNLVANCNQFNIHVHSLIVPIRFYRGQ